MSKLSCGTSRTALALAVAAGATLASAPAGAGTVALEALDGSFVLTGDILALDGGAFLIGTPLGDVRVDAARVRCSGETCPTDDPAGADLVAAGATPIAAGLMPRLLEGYAASIGARALNAGAPAAGDFVANLVGADGARGRIAVIPGASEDAFEALARGTAGIGLSTRRIAPGEAAAMPSAPVEEHLVALQPLAVVVHPANPLSQISVQDLADIRAGRIRTWEALGAPLPGAIRLVGADAPARAAQAGAWPVADTAETAAEVAADPAAIAIVPRGQPHPGKALALADSCGSVLSPDAFAVASGAYPLQRPLHFYTVAAGQSPLLPGLIAHALSPEAAPALAAAGLVGPGFAHDTGAPLALEGETANLDRLSVTFRFASGSARLDDDAARDVARLADHLAAQPSGTSVRFVGFSDDVGSPARNRFLSERRAREVAECVMAAAAGRLEHIDLAAVGLGQDSPSVCNASAEDRARNRRVEVWIERPADS